jgi:hypothetical protein
MVWLIRIAEKILFLGHKSHFLDFMLWHKYQEFKVIFFRLPQLATFGIVLSNTFCQSFEPFLTNRDHHLSQIQTESG